MHNPCILVGVIDGCVDAIVYIATVCIAIAESDCVCVCSLGHNARSKISVAGRNGREIWKVNGEFTKFSYRQS